MVLHGLVFGLIILLVHSEQGRVARQEELFIADVREVERQQEAAEKQSREDAVKDMLSDQLEAEMDALIEGALEEQDEEQLSEVTTEDIDQRVADLDQEYLLQELTNEQYWDLTDALRGQTFAQMRLSLKQMMRDMLVAQVRMFVRQRVAPQIKQQIETRLKADVGNRIRDEAARRSRAEKSARMNDIAAALKKAVSELAAIKGEQDRVRSHVQRGRFTNAAQQENAVRQKVPANAEKVDAALDKVARLSPALSDEAEALRKEPAGQQMADAAARTQAAVGKAAGAAANRAEIVSRARKQKTKPDPGQLAEADNKVKAERAEAETRSTETSATMAARIAALRDLGKKITQQTRAPKPDEIQREVVREASDEVVEAVRKKVQEEVTRTAVPVAAQRIVTALEPDLKKRRLDTKAFRTFLEKDIRKALAEEMQRRRPEAALAAMRTRERFDLRDRKPVEEARKDVADLARKLRKLAEAEEALREKTTDASASKEAVHQHDLAGRIGDTRKLATKVLDGARRATLLNDRRVNEAAAKLSKSPAAQAARDAAKSMDEKQAGEAKKQMTEAAAALKESAVALEGLEQALAKEAGDIKGRAERLVDLQKALGKDGKEKAVGDVEKAAEAVAEQRVQPNVAAAARSVNVKGILGDADALAKMQALDEQLDQIAENMEAGRALTDYLGMGVPGPGEGTGMGGIPGIDDGLYWPPGYGRRMSRFNRKAFEEFMKAMRDRMNPENYYADEQSVDAPESVADLTDPRDPVLVFIEEPPPEQDEDTGKRRVPKPEFEVLEFGAAAMMEADVTIDGDLSDWGELRHGIQMKYRRDRTRISDGPTVYVRWSPDGIYIGYKVKDTDGIQHCTEYSWKGDCLELMIDVPNSRRDDAYMNVDSQKFDFTPFGYKNNKNITVVEMGRGLRGMIMAKDYPDLAGTMGKAAGKLIPGYGYSVECFLSRRALARPLLVPGKYIALNFIINQSYDQGTLWSSPPDFNTWRRPNTWGDVLLLGSDAKLKFTDEKPDSEEPAKGIIPGDPITMEIADADMNLNTLKADRVAAELTVKDGPAALFVVLKETGPSTGVFRGSVNTQPYFMAPKENTLNARSGDVVQLVYTDARAEFGEKNRRVTADLPVGWPVMKLGRKPAN